ncbi:hypothetical protein F441_21751 [Phytophthora nicotianae CJ01A1]|uniref:Uncharacterized protein n=6 Tax=Phytophthora nicotianae TaxID=4792 RepID=W2QTC8_PHYN3|nr:hypothetical protein PPTG_21910 [Phytophthora nicotianae INRA-310]ETI31156.1 hypothetical protein F443_21869 [Phytophthora nicotianae P1569]ETK71538.1 hypothetical protein L915_21262 [Phytophthora nicotianae]ETO59871.1 hypothetical protein F444_21891 [Phytophthora nicotianae P1976]ETP00975.1 hypothetical protein F441_21751 [Phytophthora nicotianae CJ01A1]ETP29111.1 hypothetical protein F442_21729 [Phytophthora nicotianae P10297]
MELHGISLRLPSSASLRDCLLLVRVTIYQIIQVQDRQSKEQESEDGEDSSTKIQMEIKTKEAWVLQLLVQEEERGQAKTSEPDKFRSVGRVSPLTVSVRSDADPKVVSSAGMLLRCWWPSLQVDSSIQNHKQTRNSIIGNRWARKTLADNRLRVSLWW